MWEDASLWRKEAGEAEAALQCAAAKPQVLGAEWRDAGVLLGPRCAVPVAS